MRPTILAFLRSRAVGIENKASLAELVRYLRQWWPEDDYSYAWLERRVRKLIVELAPDGVCSINGGYFIARDPVEARVSYDFHRKRALAELMRAAKIRDAYPGVEQGVLF